jgi:hypothetical protein
MLPFGSEIPHIMSYIYLNMGTGYPVTSHIMTMVLDCKTSRTKLPSILRPADLGGTLLVGSENHDPLNVTSMFYTAYIHDYYTHRQAIRTLLSKPCKSSHIYKNYLLIPRDGKPSNLAHHIDGITNSRVKNFSSLISFTRSFGCNIICRFCK